MFDKKKKIPDVFVTEQGVHVDIDLLTFFNTFMHTKKITRNFHL